MDEMNYKRMIKCAFREDSGCKSTNIILSDQTDNQSFAHFFSAADGT